MCPMCLCVSKKNFNLTMLFFTRYLICYFVCFEAPPQSCFQLDEAKGIMFHQKKAPIIN
jgi:hypothetical protein